MSEIREEVGKIIERLALMYYEEDIEQEDISAEIEALGKRLFDLTGKTIEECEPFQAYWSYTTLDSVVDRILMPKVEKTGMSDEELSDYIHKFCDAIPVLPEAELDQYIKILEAETGLDDVSDYFFWPESVGLGKNPGVDAIVKKILEDRVL